MLKGAVKVLVVDVAKECKKCWAAVSSKCWAVVISVVHAVITAVLQVTVLR